MVRTFIFSENARDIKMILKKEGVNQKCQVTCISEKMSPEEVEEKLVSVMPELLVLDVEWESSVLVQFIHKLSGREGVTSIVVIANLMEQDCLISLINSNICGYVPKPVNEDVLTDVLLKAVERMENKFLVSSVARQAFSLNFDQIIPRIHSLERANQRYSLNFHEGMFRAIFIKIDVVNSSTAFLAEDETFLYLKNSIRQVILKQFRKLCYEIIFEMKHDGMFFYCNYAEAVSVSMEQCISGLLVPIRQLLRFHQGVLVTVCVGKPVARINELVLSKRQSLETLWMRMVRGIEKILYWDEPKENISPVYQRKLDLLSQRIYDAYEAMDTDQCIRCVHELFRLPKELLIRPEVRNLIRKIYKDLFLINSQLINALPESDFLELQLSEELHMAVTLHDYEERLCQQISRIMQDIKAVGYNGVTHMIRKSIRYVEENYYKKIDLETISGYVGVTPAYFSALFKKETGKNFISFVTECRLRIAKEYLKTSNMNISEIAYATGFSDAQYFSRVFMKNFGISPSGYKKKLRNQEETL